VVNASQSLRKCGKLVRDAQAQLGFELEFVDIDG
jgi:hypothetical protein